MGFNFLALSARRIYLKRSKVALFRNLIAMLEMLEKEKQEKDSYGIQFDFSDRALSLEINFH